MGDPTGGLARGKLVALPRGISRHVVRFVRVGKEVYAVKEVLEHWPGTSTGCCAT